MFVHLSMSEMLFPEEERDVAHVILSQLFSMGALHDDFGHALSLFDTCLAEMAKLNVVVPTSPSDFAKYHENREATTTLKAWSFIAARDGARVLYLTHKAMHDLNSKTIPTCKTVNQLIDHDIKRKAFALLKEKFPDFEAVRHAGAHTHELVNTPTRQKK